MGKTNYRIPTATSPPKTVKIGAMLLGLFVLLIVGFVFFPGKSVTPNDAQKKKMAVPLVTDLQEPGELKVATQFKELLQNRSDQTTFASALNETNRLDAAVFELGQSCAMSRLQDVRSFIEKAERWNLEQVRSAGFGFLVERDSLWTFMYHLTSLRGGVFSKWGELNPVEAMSHGLVLPLRHEAKAPGSMEWDYRFEIRGPVAKEIFMSWSRAKPFEAIRWWLAYEADESLWNSLTAPGVMDIASAGLSDEERLAIVNKLYELPESPKNVLTLGAMIAGWTTKDFHSVKAWAGTLENGAFKERVSNALERSMKIAQSDVERKNVQEEIRSGNFEQAMNLQLARAGNTAGTMSKVFVLWIESDVDAASDYAANFPAGWERAAMLGELFHRTCDPFPDEAQTRYLRFSEELFRARQAAAESKSDLSYLGRRKKLYLRRLAAILADDIDEAFRFAESIESEKDFGVVYQTVAQTLAINDLSGVIEWVNRWNHGEIQKNILSEMIEGMASTNLDDALSLAHYFGEQEPSRVNNALFTQLGAKLAVVDLPGGIAWAEKFRKKELRELVFSKIAERWVQKDFSSASAWIRSLPVSKGRDHLVECAVHSLLEDPVGSKKKFAKQLAILIEDPDSNRRVVQSINE